MLKQIVQTKRVPAALAGAALLLTTLLAATPASAAPDFPYASADYTWTRGEDIGSVVLPAATGGNPPLTYTLTPAADIPDGVSFDPATRTFTGAPTTTGSAQLILTATDGDAESDAMFINLLVDGPPSFSDTAVDYTWVQGADIGSVVLPAAAGGNPPLIYALTPAADIPDGVSFDPATRTLTGAPSAVGTAGLTLTATDSDGNTAATDSATLAVNITVEADEAPSFLLLSYTIFWTVGADIGAGEQLPSAVGGNPPLTYALTPEEDIPGGVTFDPATRAFSGTPTTSGTAGLTLTATDSDNNTAATDSDTLSVTVHVRPPAPANFRAEAGDGEAMLRWDDPNDAGIAKYQIRQWLGEGAEPTSWADIAGSGAGTTSHTVTELTNGTEYSFRIRAFAGLDAVSWNSDEATATPMEGLASCGDGPLYGRTQGVVDVIVAAVDGVDDCAAVTAAHLAAITGLSFYFDRLGSLRSGDFAGLTALKDLNLWGNDLTTLPEDLFAGLTALRDLNLRQNHLTALPEDLFAGLSALRDLNLWDNDLTTLPEDLFDGLSALRELSLRDNALTDLPEDLFAGLSALTRLSLEENKGLTSLPEDLFDGLTALEGLRLDMIGLTHVPADLFDGLTALTSLSLGETPLTGLPAGLFAGLSGLQFLSLDANDLTALPAGLFAGMTELSQLDLRDNNLTALPVGVFDDLSGVYYLYLQGNDLTALPAGLFAGMTTLNEVYLSGNSLTGMPADAFAGRSNLGTVELTDNALTCLPGGLFDGLSELRSLWLAGNPLGNVAPAYFAGQGLTNLRTLLLGANGASSTELADYRTVLPGLTRLELTSGAEPSYPVCEDATLRELTLTHGSPATAVALDPGFDAATEGYAARVPQEVAEVALTATATTETADPSVAEAQIAADPGTGTFAEATGGAHTAAATLSVGDNLLRVRVTAIDGETTKIYTLTVRRAAPPGNPTTLTLSTAAAAFDEDTTPRVAVTATLDDPAPTGGVTVTLAEAGSPGSATLGSDWALPSDPAFTIEAGDTEGAAAIAIIPDAVDEDDETIVLTATGLVTATGVNLAAPDHTITIIDDDAADTAPSFSPASVAYTWTVGADIGSVQLPAASGGNGDLSYALADKANIPDGVSYADATRTFSGAPTAAGTATLTLTATDSDPTDPDSAELTVNITVDAADTAPSFSPASVAYTWTVGADIGSVQLPAASGGDGDLSYALADKANIPDGVSYADATRTFSGAPAAAGTATLTLTATDSDPTDPDSAELTVNITVSDPPPPGARTIDTVAGSGTPGFSGDGGEAAKAQFNTPAGVALDAQGNLYIADTYNHRVRKVDAATGNIDTAAGDGLNAPADIAIDGAGNLYIADTGNNRILIVDAAGAIVDTVTGTQASGPLSMPSGAAPAAAGNQYIADTGNNRILTQASGPLSMPSGVALDAEGNLYIADTGNNRILIVDAAGAIVDTVTGTEASGPLSMPSGVAPAADGNLYIADTGNHRVLSVDAEGAIDTVAGTGIQGFDGDGGPAVEAQLNAPSGVAVDAEGAYLYIADTGNQRIRKVGQAPDETVPPVTPRPEPELPAVRARTFELSFTLAQDAEPAAQQVVLYAENGAANFRAQPGPQWIGAEPASGRLEEDEETTITVTADPAGLRVGAYRGRLYIRSEGRLTGRVWVALEVLPPVGPAVAERGVFNAAVQSALGARTNPFSAVRLLPVAPGSMVAVSGENFTGGESFEAGGFPLPVSLGGVRVSFDGLEGRLFAVGPQRIEAQLPSLLNLEALAGGGAATATVVVETDEGGSYARRFVTAAQAPGVFTASGEGRGQGAVLFSGTGVLAAPAGFLEGAESRPARAGEVLEIYATGLGPVYPPVADGENSCGPEGVCLADGSNMILRRTAERPRVSIGGMEVAEEAVLFAGLAPAMAAVNLVVVEVPEGIEPSDAAEVTVSIGGRASQPGVTIAVE